MWNKIAIFIIKNRLRLVIVLAMLTAFMAYHAKNAEMSYDFANVVSQDDVDMQYFQRFKQTFGEDGNILVVGMQDNKVYRLQNFKELKALSEQLAQVEGVKAVISLPNLVQVVKDTAERKFATSPIFGTFPQTQPQLDSLLQVVRNQSFYDGQIINDKTGATLLAVTVDPKFLNSARRVEVMDNVMEHTEAFTKKTGIKLHYAGLPFVRAVMTTKVAGEMKMFLLLALLVTGFTLFVSFRSFYAVLFPLLMISIVVVWVLGTLSLLDYKISLLTGLIPAILVVIGIPNSTYLLTRYHYDYRKHGNKILALSRVISKIGVVNLVTNTTTAIGFVVFTFTHVAILYEFGVVAGINIFVTFIISIVLIPVVFSYLPPPSPKQLKHLDARPLNKLLEFIDFIVHEKRYLVYFFTTLALVLSLWGIYKVKTVSYMVDDLPEESSVNADLGFFENHFNGVMPLEIIVDTGVKQGVMRLPNLGKLNQLENFLRTQPILSAPISVVGLVKTATQAFYGGNPSSYRLPDNTERNFIFSYLAKQGEGANQRLLRSFVDSTGQQARISLKVADAGSRELDTLIINKIKPELREIYGGEGVTVEEAGNTMTFTRDDSGAKTTVSLTGTTLLFIKGNEYLINNLRSSLILAFVLVTIVIALLFKSARVVIISLIPNMIPLLIAGGLMGFFNIPLKPSTALIFSIALGIAIDDSIHFLAKYRSELLTNGFNVSRAITTSLTEAGTSMIYTSVILFFGFVIFAFSEFGGTKALGVLMSVSLLIALFTNLIILPTLLMSFDSGKYERDPYALIEHYDEYYLEHEDEELDLNQLKLKIEEEILEEDKKPVNGEVQRV
ncbi:efflux RND transporter permease subunit [Pontibacter cellulosilyticus]|uniref:MMPL family transporter n=1 Tax=Pontibacter cellulosilyticus TaxID=1720253 RepID=A0A923SJT1_9BACT|nr:MMPL family transporter [Pontibacter cellulosilyticus]MBC5994148.1 MMPL family transporter [Pontibacter cellulosilyticus]